jgi:hypothetical protein
MIVMLLQDTFVIVSCTLDSESCVKSGSMYGANAYPLAHMSFHVCQTHTSRVDLCSCGRFTTMRAGRLTASDTDAAKLMYWLSRPGLTLIGFASPHTLQVHNRGIIT